MHLKACFLLIISLMLVGSITFALDTTTQVVNLNCDPISLLDLVGSDPLTLTIQAPAVGGDAPTGDTDNTTWLQYTSIVGGGVTRRLTVNWDAADTAPAGTELTIQAANPAAGGQGVKGATTGAAYTLPDNSSVAGDLVTGIGSCYTGTAAGDGVQLTHSFNITNFGLLDVDDDKVVTLTFTLTDS